MLSSTGGVLVLLQQSRTRPGRAAIGQIPGTFLWPALIPPQGSSHDSCSRKRVQILGMRPPGWHSHRWGTETAGDAKGQGRKPYLRMAGQAERSWGQPDLAELLACSSVLPWARGEKLTPILCLCPVSPTPPSLHIMPFATEGAPSHSCIPMWGGVTPEANSAFHQKALPPWPRVAYPTVHCPLDIGV